MSTTPRGHARLPLPRPEPRAPAPLPAPGAAQVWIDFDGTITQHDVLDHLIARYAVNDSWKLIEERWQAGLIGSYECLRREFALLRIGAAELKRFLDAVPLDPGLDALMTTLRRYGAPVAVLSDGIRTFITRILRRGGWGGLTVRANALVRRGDTLALRCPHASAACESAAAHCKCASADSLRLPARRTIYVGDGRSDLCPSRKADVVFAKGALARSLEREGVAFYHFSTLHDVAGALAAAWDFEAAGMESAAG